MSAERMRVEVMWAIRDARGLSRNLKTLLWAIESRGVATAHWRTLAADVDMTRSPFYRVRAEALETGLVEEIDYDGRDGLKVQVEVLAKYVPPQLLSKYAPNLLPA